MSHYRVPRFTLRLVRERKSIIAPDVMAPKAAADALHQLIGDLPYEQLWILAVDSSARIIGAIMASQGGAHGAAVTPSDILRPVVVSGAHAFILGHNHPSGSCLPSAEDLALTSNVRDAGRALNIPLLDHVIIGYGPTGAPLWHSMQAEGSFGF